MRCLCCNKPLDKNSTTLWHKSCIKKFFGTSLIPEIDLSDKNLESISLNSIDKKVTIPGVQKKLSLNILSDKNSTRLTLVNYPTGYILKPDTIEYPNLPIAEYVVMSLADIAKIKTVPHALIKYNNTYAYITKRIDRIIDHNIIKKLAMEDFCQLDNKLTESKYLGSYEECGRIIKRYSSQSTFDLTELYIRVLFCFITGNSDMHLKNFSLIEDGFNSNRYILSPAYDFLPVNIILKDDKEETALALNGKKKNIRKNDFIAFGENIGLTKNVCLKLINNIISKQDLFIEETNNSLLPSNMKQDLIKLLIDRIERLK